ncbi:Gfo/Idh/MocA family protein [Bacillus marinisedimentorum]|uniref:Gfo/Idh/MocA family protein n=1 Tax=Bacillus marinisedimentorum TaxID=1821260 RepID=UPI000872DDF4|nr:Gfo/Idh/MocA family oxidoreductase [Bacillus marinisedimentorum]
MRPLKVGMVGLGGIAQKVYLPLLSKEENWEFTGVYTPNEEKRKTIGRLYRLKPYPDLQTLSSDIDAAFVHSSTESHFEVVSHLLKSGIDVYVDKPLAADARDAEKLVELSRISQRKLMVGFNRRFAPLYEKAKETAGPPAWVRIEKHRADKVRNVPYEETLLDDYIHLVDLARWFGAEDMRFGHIEKNSEGSLVYANHAYTTADSVTVFTGMHRKAGTNAETLELVSEGQVVRVRDLESMEIERESRIECTSSPSWDSILTRRGFTGAVNHFIESIEGDTQPAADGEEGLKTQLLLEQIASESK